jgi:HD-GYP domain-containing protein (c-di-GMP phosphodiesterase class II)
MIYDVAGQKGEATLQQRGRALVMAFYVACQALRLYPLENAAVQNALEELHRVARRVADSEGVLELRVVGDFIFLNDARLRLELSDYAAYSYVSGLFDRHGIGQAEIGPEITRAEFAPFLSLLLTEPSADLAPEDAFARFSERLAITPARNIAIGPGAGGIEGVPDEDEQAKEAAKRTYFQSVQVARDVLTDMRLGRAVNVRRVKRTVQTIVDQVLTNETSIVSMTTLRDYDEYTFTHSVNVCIFSVVLGQKLGLSKVQLYELGLGALFHDLGKMRIDAAVINKPGALNEEEWELMKQHPTEGLLSVFTMRGFGEPPFRAMLMAYEHHMRLDLSGYPPNRRPRHPTLFSRIVTVADGFDAATSKRSYQHIPFPPDRVLREMRDNAGRGYDPLLVKAFINVTGVFPVGTLVILDTHELAVVVARNPDRDKVHHPVVRIISDAIGMPLAEPIMADLSEVDPATGNLRRAIIKTTDPEKYGITVADYFV